MNKHNRSLVTISGSTRFIEAIAVVSWILERDRNCMVLGMHYLPRWYTDETDHLAEAQGVADKLDRLHFDKIDLSDELYVVDVEGYIGESTKKEIEYADKAGMPIRYLSKDIDMIQSLMVDLRLGKIGQVRHV